MSIRRRTAKSRGVSLVELLVFMVLVGVAMAGLFAAFNTMTAASADPEVRKQMVAIAESLMEEVQLRPFACSGSCAGSRPFDSVSAYNGLSMTGIADITNVPVAGLGAYNASITVTPSALGSGANTVAAAASLLVRIDVSHPGSGASLTLEGYRTHYAPETDPQ
jgi:MSHA pilin protein MshD